MAGWGGARPGSGPKPRTPEQLAKRMAKTGSGAAAAVAGKTAKPTLVAAEARKGNVIDFRRVMASLRAQMAAEQDRSRQGRLPEQTPFRMLSDLHPPRAVPKEAPDVKLAMDEWGGDYQWASAAVAGFSFPGILQNGYAFLGYPFLAELAQIPEYRVIPETIATEMTREWIELTATGDEDKTAEIDELNDELERLQVQDRFCDLALQDGFFGRSHLYIDTGIDLGLTMTNNSELATPLGDPGNLKIDEITKFKFEKGQLREIRTVEAVWVYPYAYNAVNPLRKDWYLPERWYVMGTEVHRSRLLTFVGRPVPDLLKPSYSFGGLSLSQMAKPYVDNWLKTRQSVSDIIRMFSVFVLSSDLATLIQPGGGQLLERADIFNWLRDNRGLMMINKDTEDFKNVSAPLGTLDALQAQTQEHMAAVSRIPLVKLLGISPKGLNATSEGELRAFYDTIAATQRRFFGPKLQTIINFAQLNIWGKIDPAISFKFKPLWSLDEKTKADVRKIEAETGQVLMDTGAISQEEERKRIAADPDTPYQGLDVEDLPDLEEEETEGGFEPLEPKGGDQAMDTGGSETRLLPFAGDAEFKEADHPRRADGKFGSAGKSVYHGAESHFTKFDPAKIGKKDAGFLGRGFYFSTDPQVARTNTHKMELKLHVKQPLKIEQTTWNPNDKIAAVRKALDLPVDASADTVTAKLKEKGHDAVVLDYSKIGYHHQEVMVPDAKQVEYVRHLATDEFVEADHPRAPDGKFGSGGGSSAGGPEGKKAAGPFKTKKDHAEHLLKEGTTTKQMLAALGWPSISMPAMAKSLNMRLDKVKVGRETTYRGIPLGPRGQPDKTHSLLSFIASRGGIRADDGNIGDLRSSMGSNNKFMPGFGQLVRKPKQMSTAALMGGRHAPMRIDTARELAVDMGYVPENTTLPEFLDFLDREFRGERIYPIGYVAPGRPDDPAELERAQDEFESDLDAGLSEMGAEITASERKRALELWRNEGLSDPVQIIERIALEADDAESASGAPKRQPIPEWDVHDDEF